MRKRDSVLMEADRDRDRLVNKLKKTHTNNDKNGATNFVGVLLTFSASKLQIFYHLHCGSISRIFLGSKIGKMITPK